MKITIFNFTRYKTSDLRKIMKRCCKELYIKGNKVITIEYSYDDYIRGEAYIGSRKKEHSLITMFLPKLYTDSIGFARVFKHELMHTQGVIHKDMTKEQRECSHGSEWALYYNINKINS